MCSTVRILALGPERRSRTQGLLWGLCLVFFLATPVGAATHEVTFYLVPEAEWQNGSPSPQSFLPEGTVLLYRPGDYEPELTLSANERHEIPSGTWYWIAESPGYVSVASGAINAPEAGPALRKNIVWPMVPACELNLGEANWEGVQRLDAVSLDRQALFPVTPQRRQRLWIPEGRYLTYSVGARGIQGISRIERCKTPETVEVKRPGAPPPDRQALVVSALFPEGAIDPIRETEAVVEALGKRANPARQGPDASFVAGQRITWFFLDLAAARPLNLAIRHPEIQSHTVPLEPLGGSVIEPAEIQLRNRADLELVVDYAPARPHKRQETLLYHCSHRPAPNLATFDPRSCSQLEVTLTLAPGVQSFTIPDLDVGWYVPETWIDDERIFGLANNYRIEVKAEDSGTFTSPILLLKEDHIFGHLLQDGEATEGEVRLEAPTPAFGPTRRFPTDEDLLYHLYYFGSLPERYGRNLLPEGLQDRDDEELRGLYFTYVLRACNLDGFCRLFHHRSTLSGSGRLDLELGGGRGLAVEVVDAETGDPVSGAWVSAAPTDPSEKRVAETLHFVNGEVRWQSGHTIEGYGTVSDQDGKALLLDQPPGRLRLAVRAEGYDPLRQEGLVATDGGTAVRVELEPDGRNSKGGPKIRTAEGQPLVGAAVLALTPSGGTDYRCSARTTSAGEIDLKPDCLTQSDRRFILLHEAISLQVLDVGTIRQGGEIQARSAPPFPLRIRIRDLTGQPLAEIPVAVRVDGIELGPNHMVAAMSQTGRSFPLASDADGIFVFPFATSSNHNLEVRIAGPGDREWTTVPVLHPQETFLLLMD
jgi:hypothetical protein